MEQLKPKRGGARPGSGRPKGKPDRATVEQKATLEQLARTYTEAALATLHRVCTKSESDSAAVTAATAILDRGYGKPRQGVELSGNPDNPIHHRLDIDAQFGAVVGLLEDAARTKQGSLGGSGGMDTESKAVPVNA